MGYGRQVVIKETDKKPEKQAERESKGVEIPISLNK